MKDRHVFTVYNCRTRYAWMTANTHRQRGRDDHKLATPTFDEPLDFAVVNVRPMIIKM